MVERGAPDYRWRGGRVAPDAETDGGMMPGIADPLDDDLLDWRDIVAIGTEQARLYALWRRGRIGNRASKTGMALLARLADTCDRAAGCGLEDLERLVERLETEVALRKAVPPAPAARLLV